MGDAVVEADRACSELLFHLRFRVFLMSAGTVPFMIMMRNLALLTVALLTLTMCSVYATHPSTPQTTPLFCTLNGETFNQNSWIIVSGQSVSRVYVAIKVVDVSNETIYRFSTETDEDGHFKVILNSKEPMDLGRYTVWTTSRGSMATVEFTVVDGNIQLIKDLVKLVERTRSEAKAVHRQLDQNSILARDMAANIIEGDDYYGQATRLIDEIKVDAALEALRKALSCYGDALHVKDMLSSSTPPSEESLKILELLEKIRLLNDTVADLNVSPNAPAWNPLIEADDLLTVAEKQLSYGDLEMLEITLEKVCKAIENANTQTQMISSSLTLSRIGAQYKETKARVEQLKKLVITSDKAPPDYITEVAGIFRRIEDAFYVIQWIDAVSDDSPLTTYTPELKPDTDEKADALEAKILWAEHSLDLLIASGPGSETLTRAYEAYDHLKDAYLSLKSGDAERAEALYLEASELIKSLK